MAESRRLTAESFLPETCLPALPPACAARHATHRRRAHPAKLRLAPVRLRRDRALPLLPAPTPATLAASRPRARGALRAAHHPDTRRDLRSESRVRTGKAPAYRPPGNECGPARCRAAL